MHTDAAEATRVEIEDAVAMWRTTREERLAAEKVAAKIKDYETQLKEFIIAAMLSQKYEGIVKDMRLTYVRETEVPTAVDRQAFEAYILAEQDLSLLQFRPAVGAIRERQENGVEVPGIQMIKTYDLGDRKA